MVYHLLLKLTIGLRLLFFIFSRLLIHCLYVIMPNTSSLVVLAGLSIVKMEKMNVFLACCVKVV